MALNDTVKRMRDLLSTLAVDLEKAASGNKAASQRVRTGTIRMEKVAKIYRKESINAEKSGGMRRPAKKAAAKKAAPSKTQSKQAKMKARTKTVQPAKKAVMMKRKTANIPVKKA